MKYITKYFIAYKNLKENEKDIDKIFDKSKYQSEIDKCENLFDDVLVVDESKNNFKKINFEFDYPDSNREIINELDEILKFENFINDKILNRSSSLSYFTKMGSLDITKKNIYSEIDQVLNNIKNDQEKKDMLEYDRFTIFFCEDLIESFEKQGIANVIVLLLFIVM